MKKLLILTLILSLAFGATAFAQMEMKKPGDCDGSKMGPHGKHPRMDKHHGMRGDGCGIKGILAHGDDINLTDQQREQLKEMNVEFKTQQIDQKAELEKARVQLKALMRDDADQGDVNSAIDKVAALKAEMQKTKYANKQKVKAVLTEEQVDKLKAMKKTMMKKKVDCKTPCAPGCKPKGKG